MSCHLQKDFTSTEFVSGLQQCTNTPRRTQEFMYKTKDEAGAFDPTDFFFPQLV